MPNYCVMQKAIPHREDRPTLPALRASSYEPGNRAGSVIGTNSVVCSYGKFQLG